MTKHHEKQTNNEQKQINDNDKQIDKQRNHVKQKPQRQPRTTMTANKHKN